MAPEGSGSTEGTGNAEGTGNTEGTGSTENVGNAENPGGAGDVGKRRERDARPIVWIIGFLVVALFVYFAMLGWRGFGLIATGEVAGIGLGVGVILLPIIGVWLVYSTLRAGIEHQQLARAIKDDGRELDISHLPIRPSGRLERDAADELFAQVKAEWEADPEDWRNTYRIARAYDYAGDRTRAREMMKRAVGQYHHVQGR